MNVTMIGFQTWLESAANYEKQKKSGEFSLKTISLLANELNNPQDSFSSFHIAGSKGKGSVSTMIASILHSAGFKEGLYTSPHLINFLERVSSTSGLLPASVYEKSAAELIAFIEDKTDELEEAGLNQASWFELMTLFSFLCFKRYGVDWGVFETGLGGRLDATNVLRPKVSIITPIELEHTEMLGDTLEKIAFEKAGIIKSNTPVCISSQKDAVKEVFIKKAKEKKAPIYFLENILKDSSYSFSSGKMKATLTFGRTTPFSLKKLFKRPLSFNLQLLGSIQVENAALAALAVKLALPQISEETIELGLSSAKLPARFEILKIKYRNENTFTVILDGAHTYNSVKLCLETYSHIYKDTDFNLLFACAYDKKIEEIAPLFFEGKKPKAVFLTKPGENKPSDYERLTKTFIPLCKNNECSVTSNENYSDVILTSLTETALKKGILLITGSFYLAAEVKNLLRLNENFSFVEG